MESVTIQLDTLFEEYAQPDVPGAAVMVIEQGKPLVAKAYGLANLEDRTPCDTETNFRLASLTKQFTAMAVMLLWERKKLWLDGRLGDFLPEFPEHAKQVTIRHLLTHTAGLMDYEELIPAGTRTPVRDRDVLGLLAQEGRTYFTPGSSFRYSNSGYALLALIVELCSGQTFAQFLAQNIFGPLEMTGTVAYEPGVSLVRHRAYGYSAGAGSFWRTDQCLTSSVLGDGGVYSSVADLCKWDQALYASQLVSQKTLELAFTPATASDHPNTGYGFGWYVGQHRGLKEIWHRGNTIGFTTRIARFPEKQFTVIILTNRNEASLAALPHRIADVVWRQPG